MTARLGRDIVGKVAAFVLVALVALALLGPVVSPHEPHVQDVGNRLAGPSWGHWLGTDQYGRDTLVRLSTGLRTTLLIAVAATAVGVVVGTGLGSASAFIGGRIDAGIAGLLDVLLVFPTLLLGMMIMVALGPGADKLILAAGIVLTVRFARIARAQAQTVRALEFVDAAIVAGKPRRTIIASEIVPNVAPHVLALSTYWFYRAVTMEAGLSFLGIGVAPPTASIGIGIREGLDSVYSSTWIILSYCGVMILLIVSATAVADRLADRDAT